jgi:hypothetical protein
MTNRVANPILGFVLKGRMAARWGRHLAVVRYEGRLTGRPRELIVQYARDGSTVLILPGSAHRKTWWRNFEEPRDVELVLAGALVRGRGLVIDGRADPVRVHDALVTFFRTVPRARKALGLPAGGEPLADGALVDLAARSVVLRVDLRFEESVPTALITEVEEL